MNKTSHPSVRPAMTAKNMFKTPGYFAGQPYNPADYESDSAIVVSPAPRPRRAPANTRRETVRDRVLSSIRRHPGTVLMLGIALGTVAHIMIPYWTPGFLLGVVAASIWRVVKR